MAGKQAGFVPLQPDFDYSTDPFCLQCEYLVVDVQKSDQDPFVCTTNYSASNPLAMRLRINHIMGIDPSVEGERFNAYDGNRIQASSQFLEPRGITVYSEVPYVVGSGQLNGRLIAKPSHLRKTISKLGRSFHLV